MKLKYLCLQATQEGQASYTHVHEIINGLQKRGWDVELFEPSYSKKNFAPTILQRLFEFIFTQLKLLIKIKKGDLIYIRSHFAAFPTSIVAKLRKIPVIQEVNGPYEDLFIAWPWTRHFKGFFKWLIKVQYKISDAIIVVTPQLKEWIMSEIGGSKSTNIYVISNGANTNLFTPNAESKYKLEKPYVVFFGALAPWQGIDTMLEAVQDSNWPENVKLVIMGDGVERPKVEKAVQENNRIIYLGKIPYKEVPGVVSNSIAGLSPKNNIGGRSNTGLSPLKVYEILACGVPAIVTDFPGQADIIREHQCGIVVSLDSPEEIARAVRYLYEDENKRKEMGRRGREVILKEHSWDRKAEYTEKVLREILKKRVKYEK
ncbi:MAG: glycosyltransferase WbuB [Dictyoglomus sp. NZ13-RE01]|nr:MAG: glycosyltransferase WbuB [Dictyoglomus sp. NZ13-RE01]